MEGQVSLNVCQISQLHNCINGYCIYVQWVISPCILQYIISELNLGIFSLILVTLSFVKWEYT